MQHKFEEIEINYESLLDFDFSNISEETIQIKVVKESINYEFLLRRKLQSNKCIIFGSGAYDNKKISLPVYQRFSWREMFNENLVFYNDPTLYVGDVTIAWGYGDEKTHYLLVVGEILNIILEKMGIDNTKTAIYGSSGGGFMALILASIVKGSKAIVNNPQTNIRNYYESALEKLFEYIYPTKDLDYALSIYPERIDVIKFFKKQKYVPEIIYYQNISCINDVNKQLNPFINSLRCIDEKEYSEKVTLKLYCNKEQNHSPLPMVETVNIINKSISAKIIYENKLIIKSSDWIEVSSNNDYTVYKYDAKIFGKSYSYKYKILVDSVEFHNIHLRKFNREGYSYIDELGYIYISLLKELDEISEINEELKVSLDRINVEVYY